ncbi:MAG: nif-specific transcriptional activator NifA [Pseudomonadota bacterium]
MSTAVLAENTRRQRPELLAIYEISKILSSSLDLQRTLHGVLNLLVSYMGMRRGTVSLLDAGDQLRAVGAADLSDDALLRARYRIGEGITGRILKTGSPCVVPDVAKEPLFLNRTGARDLAAGQVIAFIGVPIKVGRDTIGVLTVDREVTDQAANFERDVRFLSMVANLIGQTVRLHRSVAAERAELLHEKHRLQKELQGDYQLDNVIGTSRAMQEVFAEVHQVATGRATVLLRGESGTGKEVIARAIHMLSPRSGGPFVRVNCAALSENLLESELFGHEKGAFTGATAERKGRFELADGGTLFLDEIGEVSPSFQTKLLRVLQEREFERVGGNRPIKTDVRLVCATNRNLEEAVGRGTFREDLYFRINVVTLFLPPLRERREDIPPLIEHFLTRYNAESHRAITLSREALQIMLACNWPGNVRELENCVERCATMTRGDVVRATDMPCQHGKCFSLVLQGYTGVPHEAPITPAAPVVAVRLPTPAAAGPAEPGEPPPDDERGRLVWAMQQCGWVQAKAARLLGITPRQIGYALRKYDVQVRRF